MGTVARLEWLHPCIEEGSGSHILLAPDAFSDWGEICPMPSLQRPLRPSHPAFR